MYGDGGFYFTQPVSPDATYGDGGFFFTQPVSPTNAAYAGWRVYDYHQGSYGAFHAARLKRKGAYGLPPSFQRTPRIASPKVVGQKEVCPTPGVWYIESLDPCGPRPSAIPESEWNEYKRTGKVPQLFAYAVPAGPRSCTEAATLYKVAQATKKLAQSSPLLKNLRVATDEELRAMWCAMVSHGCVPDPQMLCGDPNTQTETPESKSEVSNTIGTEEGFFARNRTAVIAVSAVAAIGALWFAKKKGVF